MNDYFSTPIAIFIFNRPKMTRRLFSIIEAIKPKKLFIIADGPRNQQEKHLCDQARLITEKIDWPCTIERLYSDINLGCKIRVSSGLDWFFEHVEQGIVLEDDCLPNLSFFTFSKEMLDKYKNNNRIMHISGNNFYPKSINPYSYYYSKIPHIWGWATWRRAWQKYDVKMQDYMAFKKENKLKQIFPYNNWAQIVWDNLFEKCYTNTINTWDYQWTYAIFKSNGICLTPSVNLVSNIGFNEQATHTNKNSRFENLTTNEIIKIVHPPEIIIDHNADQNILIHNFDASLLRYLLNRLKKLWGKLYYSLLIIKNKYHNA